MPDSARRWIPYALVAAVSAWLASTATDPGDWSIDAAPAVSALAGGHVGDYLNSEAMMGPFATLIQAPFVALSSGSELIDYRFASFPCLLAVGLLGLYLAGVARRRGMSPVGQGAIALLCLVNPLTLEALGNGHPEELLTAALAVGAIASALEDRPRATALLLGLAIASKQWAVVAALPALLALPSRRLRVGAIAAAIVVLLTLPAIVASPDSFAGVQGNAAQTGRVVTPWSVWYPTAEVVTEVHRLDGVRLVAHVHEAPPLVGSVSHPLIVLLALGLPLALVLAVGTPLRAGQAFALLTLLALLRCALDPVDNLYYHAPLLLSLLGWDAFCARQLPWRGIVGAAAATFFWTYSNNLSDPSAFNLVYIAAVSAAAIAVSSSLLGSIRWTGVAQRRLLV